MEPEQNNFSQKEYLKKYFSKDKSKKKKVKVSSSSHIKRSVIIDDDLELPSNANIDDEEFNLEYLGDEAPQIAGIIDERPPEVKAKESYGDPNKWKSLDGTEENTFIKNLIGKLSSQNAKKTEKSLDTGDTQVNKNLMSGESDKFSDSESLRKNKKEVKRGADPSSLRSRMKELDSPPLRRNSKSKKEVNQSDDSDLSPPRNRKMKAGHDSDLSPPRGKFTNGKKAKYASDSGSDLSPPRKRDGSHVSSKKSSRKYREDNDSDLPYFKSRGARRDIEKKSDRHKHSRSDSDLSPPRWKDRDRRHKDKRKDLKSNYDSDASPPRRKEKDYHSRERQKPKKTERDSDLSPPRRKGRDQKFKGKQKGYKSNSDSDLSPPRKKGRDHKTKESHRHKSDSDSDPPPRRKDSERYSKTAGNHHKGNRNDSESDLSPPRKHKEKDGQGEDGRKSMKLDKTLDGKRAGLQSAKNVRDELKKLRANEDADFSKMQASVSGKNASAVVRDRKTGKIRDLEKEKQELVEKSAKTIEHEKKYAKWGRGLKQIEEAEERVADALREMNKPLARYAGDEDLEQMLKRREREDDPMLEYIMNAQAESIVVDNIGKPKYKGHFMPNRFGIRPGHRWDGVDRSNGYEQKWFERQNAQKALQEEAHKWSTSDM